jgi:selenide,water dikinase
VLRQLPTFHDPNILVDMSTSDDAAVYKISDDLAIVQTLDYITPVIDDPYTFGQVAAANSISDIYAMGAKPIMALNVVGFPRKKLPLDILVEILKGGSQKAAEANIGIVGGHSVDDDEPKYGLAVTGIVDPKKIISNSKAQIGDVLVLTKPIGTGIVTTAIKNDEAPEKVVIEAMQVMIALNKNASETMLNFKVHACTDVTGFGLLGHLYGMTKASKVGAKIRFSSIPHLNGVWELLEKDNAPGGTHSNLRYLNQNQLIVWGRSLSENQKLLLCDAQTSGGLIIAIPQAESQELMDAMLNAGVETVAQIGEIIEDSDGRIWVEV